MARRWLRVPMVALSIAALVAGSASAALAGRPMAGCPTAYMDIPITLAMALDPKPEEVHAFFTSYFERTDKNHDGLVCTKDLPDTPGIAPFVTQIMDNVASS